jgi:hypothetical protein
VEQICYSDRFMRSRLVESEYKSEYKRKAQRFSYAAQGVATLVRLSALVRHVRRGACGGLGPPFVGVQTASIPDRSTLQPTLYRVLDPGCTRYMSSTPPETHNISAIVMVRSNPFGREGFDAYYRWYLQCIASHKMSSPLRTRNRFVSSV